MSTLPDYLVEEITARIQDPRLRHEAQPATYLGTFTDPDAVDRQLNADNPQGGEAWQAVVKQMQAWGQAMPPMHLFRGEGFTSASSEREDALPLAPPATEAEIAAVEQAIGRPLPADLCQVYRLANGGWGPGNAYTHGFGTGLLGTAALVTTLEDLRRRGPDYTGEIPWPDHYLPIGDTTGTIAYDLDSGEIRLFDEYFRDHGLTAEQAWSTHSPSLADWLDAWLSR